MSNTSRENFCRGHAPGIAFGITMVVLLLAGGAGAITPISSCGTIYLPGEYVLNGNLVSSTTCISITSSNVILDGAGYSITGTGVSNTQFGGSGFRLDSSSNFNTLTNNTANQNGVTGIILDTSSGNILMNNIGSSNGDIGIWLTSSSNNNILIKNTLNVKLRGQICFQFFRCEHGYLLI
jgi:parallel beta-helix repeat protein